MKLSEELKWRGFINHTTFSHIEQIDTKPWVFYHGIDASADSLTIGNLASLMLAKLLIKHKNTAILLAGGATSLIGDPGGKDNERPMLPRDQIEENMAKIEHQLRTLFGSESKVVNNLTWYQNMGILEFLRDIGKHFSMTPLVQRDYIASRIGQDGAGISFTEFSYTLLQGYDYLHLYKTYNAELQIAGSDQWGNMLSGVDLIRKIAGREVHALTMPLIVNEATGKKFGKSEEGAVWLDPKKTSPTKFYQFWINTDDRGVGKFLKIYTELSQEDIARIMQKHEENPSLRVAQVELARYVTKLVHGEQDVRIAEAVTKIITGQQQLSDIHHEVLGALRSEIPSIKSPLNASIIDLLVSSGLASSNTEARRLLDDGAVYINNAVTTKQNVEYSDFENKRMLLRRGKAFKDSALIELD